MNIYDSWLVKMPIAHRGLHNEKFPENSFSAFQNAIDNGYAIEIDVRPIDDGTVVVFHDVQLSRLTGKDSYVCKLKAEELENIRLLNTDEKIPLFKDFLEFINGRTPVLVEIKNDGRVGALEQNVFELLKDYKGEFAVQSFNPYSLEFFRIHAPHFLRGQLACNMHETNYSRVKKFVLERMLLNHRVSRPNFISYCAANLPVRCVTKQKGKMPIIGWTIRSNSDLEYARKYCDNIIFEGFDLKM